MKKFFAEFKEFAMRGNVMDMAVGVIIGTAFGKITTSLVNDVFMPLIGLLIGGVDLGQLNIVLKPEVLDEAGQVVTEAVTLGIGTFLSTVIDFVLVAFVIFLMVKTINQLHKLGKKDEEPQEEEEPAPTSEELLAHLPELQQLCCPETLNLCSIDSTDLGPEHWLMMAKAVQENYALYDGFIICHGTDTLAYSAAALSYLIQNADKPIILTGAQQPISNEITDAKKNLRDSVICALDPGSRGVMVVFGGHVIAGTRAKKNKTISYDAFASVNFPALALVQGDRLVRYVPSPWPTGPVEFGRSLSPRVFLLKLTPGLSPDLIPDIFRLYDCVIVESFGVGGLPCYEQADFLSAASAWSSAGKPIVITTQVPHEGSDLAVYQVGARVAAQPGILQAYTMTAEAVVTKLMWILPQTRDLAQIKRLFYTPIACDLLLFEEHGQHTDESN